MNNKEFTHPIPSTKTADKSNELLALKELSRAFPRVHVFPVSGTCPFDGILALSLGGNEYDLAGFIEVKTRTKNLRDLDHLLLSKHKWLKFVEASKSFGSARGKTLSLIYLLKDLDGYWFKKLKAKDELGEIVIDRRAQTGWEGDIETCVVITKEGFKPL